MPRRSDALSSDFSVCRWVNIEEALHHFATHTGATQSQQHIKPLHWYVACRLVLEGGFHPDDITPRPPFSVDFRSGKFLLRFDPSSASGGERTILGGLKTKNVDVVVTKEGIGPVMSVSCKGMTGAFRNLTNRMEETIGECTNLHITYPAMVFGYLFVIRAHREGGADMAANDIAVQSNGAPVESINRFHSALCQLTGRRGIRNDVSRYEAVALSLVEPSGDAAGTLIDEFPSVTSPLHLSKFFQTLYLRYEERYLLGAPDLKSVTRRIQWDEASTAFAPNGDVRKSIPELEYEIRLRTDE